MVIISFFPIRWGKKKSSVVSRSSSHRVGNGNPNILLLRENECNLSRGKCNNIYVDKKDLEVPLLGVYSINRLSKNLPRHIFWERVGLPCSVPLVLSPVLEGLHQHETMAFLCSLVHSSQEEVE